MSYISLKNKKIAIWGLGKEGHSVLHFLEDKFPEKTIGILTEDNAEEALSYDIIFKSPGVSFYHPVLKKAKEKGIIISSAVNLYLDNKSNKTTVIGITGSKGKSTTTALLANTLKTMGKNVEIGGNFGCPASEFIEHDPDYLVLELSSYQCTDVAKGLDRAVVLDLYPEHLNWHLSHEQYFKDKLHILTSVADKKHAFVNADNERIQKLINVSDYSVFNHPNGFWIQDDFFMKQNERFFPISSLSLQGRHFAEDALAVLSVIDSLGLDVKEAEKAFQTFKGLPHRLEICYQNDQMVCVDDSISTIPEAALAALNTVKKDPVALIAGGFDRGQDFSTLTSYLIEYHIFLIAMPDTGKRLFDAVINQGGQAVFVPTMKEAVKQGVDFLKGKGTLLLSPASSSYNAYKNYEEKGDDFQTEVKALLTE